MAQDPSDQNFTAFAQPNTPAYTPFTAQPGLTQAEADAFNALYSNEVQAVGVTSAVLTTIDRAQGASDAGNSTYENLQLQHLQQLDQQLSSLMFADANLRSNLTSVLTAAGVNQVVTADDVSTFENGVASNGLTPSMISELTQLGATSDEIDQITQELIVQDPSQVAGTFPANLSSQTLLADLQSVANDLHQAVVTGGVSPSSITGETGPTAVTSVAAPALVGTAPAGTTIQVFAQAANGTAVMVGQSAVGSSGQWSITSSKLADGTYTFSMNVIGSTGSVLPSTLRTVVIDTSVLEVSAVTYNRATGRVSITLQDPGPAGFDLGSLTDLANYAARSGKSARSRSYRISGPTVTPGASGTETVTCNLVASGKTKRAARLPKSFYLTLHSGGIRNAAGSALDGEFKNALPSGDGQAGGDFVALVPIQIKRPKSPRKK